MNGQDVRTMWTGGKIPPRRWAGIRPRAAPALAVLVLAALVAALSAPAAGSNGQPGSVWAWGRNEYGQVGDGTTTDRHAPVQVTALDDVAAVAGGFSHSLALRADGTVWAWGSNGVGALGDGTSTDRYSPVQTAGGLLTDVVAVAAGASHSLALRADGTVWSWGYNGTGQLGDGTITNRHSPQQIAGLDQVIAIAAGREHSLAVRADGTVWAWGRNHHGQLGDGTTTNRTSPVPTAGGLFTDVIAVAAGHGHHSLAVRADGTVWAWGRNAGWQLGDGSSTDRHAPVQTVELDDVVAVAGGWAHSVAVRGDGTVWAWGSNSYGQLGDGTTFAHLTPTHIGSLSDAVAISAGSVHTVAVRGDGTVWAWGSNQFGQLGDGTTTDRLSPVQATGLADIAGVAAGARHTLAAEGLEPEPDPAPDPDPDPGPAPDPTPGPEPAEACQPDVPPADFGDTAGNVHEAAIDCVVWWDIAQGVTADEYRPAQPVTRAQMASFLARVIDRSHTALPAASQDHFADDDGNPHEDNINRLAEAGIAQGIAAGVFAPNASVTRAQMTTFLVRTFEYITQTELTFSQDHFADDDGNPHEPNINKAAEAGFTTGTGPGTFAPSLHVRRDQMASFLARMLDELVGGGHADAPA